MIQKYEVAEATQEDKEFATQWVLHGGELPQTIDEMADFLAWARQSRDA